MKPCTIFLCLVIASCLQATPFDSLHARLQTAADHFIGQHGYPGVSLAILGDTVKITVASGLENRAKGTPLEAGHLMPAGSIGKTYTAAILLQLIEEGKVHPGDRLSTYFGKEKWYRKLPGAQVITVEMLLHHTSGLPRYLFLPGFRACIAENPNRPLSPIACLSLLHGTASVHPPGKGWSYSDSNYLLLGLLIEKLTGKPYSSILEEQILYPFMMHETRILDTRYQPGLAQGYSGDAPLFALPDTTLSGDSLNFHPGFEWAGGGLATTPSDLVDWFYALENGIVVPKTWVDYAQQVVSTSSGIASLSGYGAGMFAGTWHQRTVYFHPGIFPGYQAFVAWDPNIRAAIAIQVNTDQDLGRHLMSFAGSLAEIVEGWQQEQDRDAILANFRMQEACWNAGSVDCYMTAYANEDSICTVSRNGVTCGYDNILKNYKHAFPPGNMGRLAFDQLKLKKISADAYLVTGRFNLSFSEAPNPVQGYFSVILQKIKGSWLMTHDHSS